MKHPTIPSDPPRPEREQGTLAALRYALQIAQNRRATVRRQDAYKAACTDIEIAIAAAIERVERGQQMESTAACD